MNFVLVSDNQLAGTVDGVKPDVLPPGFTAYEAPTGADYSDLWYNPATDKVEVKPSKPSLDAFWNIDHWVVPQPPEVIMPPTLDPELALMMKGISLVMTSTDPNLQLLAQLFRAVFAEYKGNQNNLTDAIAQIRTLIDGRQQH